MFNLDNTTKDTLEKEIANDDIVVSNINIKATPKIVFVQDKLVAAYNFHANDLDEHVNAVDDEINEVKAAKLVKSCSLLLEHQSVLNIKNRSIVQLRQCFLSNL